MRYFIADAFADSPFGGNPAGVVLLENGHPFPDDSLMLKIAAELRYSETAFVQQNSPDEFTLKYFTPAAQVELCGHATIASFSVLLDEGAVEPGSHYIAHTLAGDLKIVAGEKIMMQMAVPQVMGTVDDSIRLSNIMGIPQQECEIILQQKRLVPQIVSTGLPDIIMPVSSVEALQSIAPDMDALAALSKELDVVGVHAFAIAQDGYTAHVRNFAPLYDIPEESATGTANAALTYYLYSHNFISLGGKCTFLQGEVMGRPSVVATELDPHGIVFVGGNSYILGKGELFV